MYDFIYGNRMFRQFKVDDLLFTEYDCPLKEAVFKVWSHHNYFVYAFSGKKKWRTLHSEYLVQAGEAIFLKKGANIVHQFFEDDFCVLIIFVPDHFISNVIRQNPVPFPETQQEIDSIIPVYLDGRLSTYFQSLFAYFLQKDAPPKILLEVKFKELILSQVSSARNGLLCHYFKTLCQTAKCSLRAIMEENFMYNLSLAEYARLCGRSLTTFKREFRALYNTSPGKWLVKKRVDYSRYLLATTDNNINELAFLSGFENTSHFIRTFKKGIWSHSPSVQKVGDNRLNFREHFPAFSANPPFCLTPTFVGGCRCTRQKNIP